MENTNIMQEIARIEALPQITPSREATNEDKERASRALKRLSNCYIGTRRKGHCTTVYQLGHRVAELWIGRTYTDIWMLPEYRDIVSDQGKLLPGDNSGFLQIGYPDAETATAMFQEIVNSVLA